MISRNESSFSCPSMNVIGGRINFRSRSASPEIPNKKFRIFEFGLRWIEAMQQTYLQLIFNSKVLSTSYRHKRGRSFPFSSFRLTQFMRRQSYPFRSFTRQISFENTKWIKFSLMMSIKLEIKIVIVLMFRIIFMHVA